METRAFEYHASSAANQTLNLTSAVWTFYGGFVLYTLKFLKRETTRLAFVFIGRHFHYLQIKPFVFIIKFTFGSSFDRCREFQRAIAKYTGLFAELVVANIFAALKRTIEIR